MRLSSPPLAILAARWFGIERRQQNHVQIDLAPGLCRPVFEHVNLAA
jgi:hypothetical protein